MKAIFFGLVFGLSLWCQDSDDDRLQRQKQTTQQAIDDTQARMRETQRKIHGAAAAKRSDCRTEYEALKDKRFSDLTVAEITRVSFCLDHWKLNLEEALTPK